MERICLWFYRHTVHHSTSQWWSHTERWGWRVYFAFIHCILSGIQYFEFSFIFSIIRIAYCQLNSTLYVHQSHYWSINIEDRNPCRRAYQTIEIEVHRTNPVKHWSHSIVFSINRPGKLPSLSLHPTIFISVSTDRRSIIIFH